MKLLISALLLLSFSSFAGKKCKEGATRVHNNVTFKCVNGAWVLDDDRFDGNGKLPDRGQANQEGGRNKPVKRKINLRSK